MEMKNTQSGEALLREIRANANASNRAVLRLNLAFIAISICFTAGLWLFAVLTQ